MIGIQPSEFRAMTPAELFETQEAWVEAQGGTSRRQRRASMAEYARLKRRYPDQPGCQEAP